MRNLWIPGLLIFMILGIGIVGAVSPEVVDAHPISIDQAKVHAEMVLTGFLLGGSPGLDSASPKSDWSGAAINPKPLEIYDVNGKILFYQFYTEKDGQRLGQIKISANKLLGSPFVTLELTPQSWNLDTELQKAKDVVLKEYPDAIITDARLVCYSYPKLGIGVTISSPTLKNGKEVFVDLAYQNIVPDSMVISIFDAITDDQATKLATDWNDKDQHVQAIKDRIKKGGINIDAPLSKGNIGQLKEILPDVLTSSKVLSMTRFEQTNSSRCVPTVGQMIAYYYGVSHTQDHIAYEMGTTSTGTLIGDTSYGELHYYRNALPNHLGKSQSTYELHPTWETTKAEIDANRPLDGRIYILGFGRHARAVAGWGIDEFYGKSNYFHDPWYGAGSYWESWSNDAFWKYEANVYVR